MAATTTFPLLPSPTRLVLAPLTTAFTAPGACNVFAPFGGVAGFGGWQGQNCHAGSAVDAATCWPPALVPVPQQPFDGWGFYSPGIECPAGYETACGAALAADGSPLTVTAAEAPFSFQHPLAAGETAGGCCPT
jgi:hypothetical protein